MNSNQGSGIGYGGERPFPEPEYVQVHAKLTSLRSLIRGCFWTEDKRFLYPRSCLCTQVYAAKNVRPRHYPLKPLNPQPNNRQPNTTNIMNNTYRPSMSASWFTLAWFTFVWSVHGLLVWSVGNSVHSHVLCLLCCGLAASVASSCLVVGT